MRIVRQVGRQRTQAGGTDGATEPPEEQRPRVVLIAHDVDDRGGMERSLAETVSRAASRVKFCVVSSTLAPSLRDRVEWRRVPVPRRPFLLKFAVFYVLGSFRVATAGPGLRQAMGAIIPNRADIAIVQFCHAGYLAKAGRSALRALSPLKALHERLARWISLWAERWSYRGGRLRCFVAVSDGVRRELADFYGGIPCVVAPNGVDHERFKPDPAGRPAFREELGVGPEEFVTVFVGGDWARKGADVAIVAVGEARRSYALPVTLWVVGPGDAAMFRGLATAEGVEPHVRFFGPRSDTERFYQAADAFLFPSLYEAFPLVALEAAACGLPIVATSINGIEELEAARAAVTAERSPSALAQALSQIASDHHRRETLGRAAHDEAKRYTWERQTTTLLALYDELGSRDHSLPAN